MKFSAVTTFLRKLKSAASGVEIAAGFAIPPVAAQAPVSLSSQHSATTRQLSKSVLPYSKRRGYGAVLLAPSALGSDQQIKNILFASGPRRNRRVSGLCCDPANLAPHVCRMA